MRLKDKVAFITGAGSGIGAVTARMLAAEGAKVALAARGLERCETVAAGIRAAGGEAIAIRMDQTSEEQVAAALAAAKDAFGDTTILVNNAGPVDLLQSGTDGLVHEMGTKAFDDIVKVTLYGPFWCCKYAIPQMMAAGVGSIVNISSIAAVTGLPLVPAYSAAKGALSALTRSLAFDYGRHRIRANGVIVGLILHEGSGGQVDTPEKRQAYEVRHLTRLGQGSDIGNAVIYLSSDESAFVTGSHINVEGGVLVKSRPDTVLIKN